LDTIFLRRRKKSFLTLAGPTKVPGSNWRKDCSVDCAAEMAQEMPMGKPKKTGRLIQAPPMSKACQQQDNVDLRFIAG
jgi:hypothetical protein